MPEPNKIYLESLEEEEFSGICVTIADETEENIKTELTHRISTPHQLFAVLYHIDTAFPNMIELYIEFKEKKHDRGTPN